MSPPSTTAHWLSPPPLRPGDRVRLVAASSALAEATRLEAGIAISTFAVAGESLSVDTAEQLEQARALAAACA